MKELDLIWDQQLFETQRSYTQNWRLPFSRSATPDLVCIPNSMKCSASGPRAGLGTASTSRVSGA
jgi:hypothetical protein